MNKFKFFVAAFVLLISSMLYAAEDKTELKGNIKITNYIHPVLEINGKTYVLMMPRFLTYDIEEGTNVTVEGNLLTEYKSDKNNSNYEYVYVTKVTYDGKTIDVNKYRGSMMEKRFGNKNFDGNYPGGYGCWR